MIRPFLTLLLLVASIGSTDFLMAAEPFEAPLSERQARVSDSSENITKARALVDQGKLDEAEHLLQQDLSLSPTPERIYYELGCLYEQRGTYVQALAAFKEGVRIHEQGRRQRP